MEKIRLKNKTDKTISIVLMLLIIFIFINSTYADENNNITQANEIIDNETSNIISNETSNSKILSFKEQQEQVKENLNIAKEKLEFVEDELSITLLQIQNLEQRISEEQVKLDEINANYSEVQRKVNETQAKLDVIQEEYDKKDQMLRKRLVALYKSGSMTYLDVLFNSKNVIDFVSRYYVIKRIAEYDSKSLIEIEKQKKEVEKTSKELNEQKANMKIVKAQAEEQTVVLTNTKTIVENHKLSLTDSEMQLKSEIDAYLKQQEELENLIQYAIMGSTYELQYSGGVMIWPTLTTSYITSSFGTRLHPIQGIIKNHDGIDIGGNMGDPIYAAADGVIIYSDYNNGGYGNMVMIDHGLNEEGIKIVTLYGHGSKLLKTVGDTVKQGDIIMEVGSTGNSTGPHVHFEVRENGLSVDPKKYLSN